MSTAVEDFEAFIRSGGFARLADAPPAPMPTFVSQREFRTAILLCETRGWPDEAWFGSRPIVIHPDSYRWYQGRLALRRMAAHFDMLDGE